MLQEIVETYIAAGEPWPATMRTVAGWAIRAGQWKAQPDTQVTQCARELADALREEYTTDPQGRRVRTKHAYVTKQGTFWTDDHTGTPAERQMSFAQRRRQILGDCRQLKIDVDSYNDNNPHGAHIQMIFDFTDDLVEMEQPTEYAGKA
jgi:hypothetical protein